MLMENELKDLVSTEQISLHLLASSQNPNFRYNNISYNHNRYFR